jgi:hypothetical protein
MTGRRLGSVLLVVLGAFGCSKSSFTPLICAPHDTSCQARQEGLNSPSCRNGKGSNAQCLDQRAPP